MSKIKSIYSKKHSAVATTAVVAAGMFGVMAGTHIPSVANLVHADELTPAAPTISKTVTYGNQKATQIQLKNHDDSFGYEIDATVPVNAVQKSLTISDPVEGVQTFTPNDVHIYDGNTDITSQGHLSVNNQDGQKVVTWDAGDSEITKLKNSNGTSNLKMTITPVTLKGDSISSEAKYSVGNIVSVPNSATITLDKGYKSNTADLLQNGITGTVVNHRLHLNVPHGDLDNAVTALKNAGAQVTQNPDTTKTVDSTQAQQAETDVENDYKSQTSNLQNLLNQQKTVNDINGKLKNGPDSSEVDKMASELQGAGVKVIKDADQTITGPATDYDKDMSSIKSQYDSMVNSAKQAEAQQKQYDDDYNKKMAQYQKDEADYQQKLDAYNKAVAGLSQNGVVLNGIDTNQIKQQLVLDKSPNAQMDYKVIGGQNQIESVKRYTPPDYGVAGNSDSKNDVLVNANSKNGISGPFLECTYTNLNAFYQNQNISKIVATFSDLEADNAQGVDTDGDRDPAGNPFLRVYSDPAETLWYCNSQGITVDYKFYDKNGKQINFDKDTAYVTVSSLNNQTTSSFQHLEKAALESDGQAYSLKGSSVTAHGNTLYSDNDNNTNQKIWDTSGSVQQFYGAGVFGVTGNNIKLHFYVDRKDDSNAGVWAMFSTTIPFVPTKPQEPQKPVHQQATWNYHHINLNLTPEAPVKANYHYDVIDTNLPPMEQTAKSNQTLVKTQNDNTKTTIQKGVMAEGDKDGFKSYTNKDGSFQIAQESLQLKDHTSLYRYLINVSINPVDVKKSLTIEDPLNNVQSQSVKAENVKIYDQSGKDVTNQFKISINKSGKATTVDATANSDVINSIQSQHKNVNYQMVINHVSMNGASNADMDAVRNDKGQLVVPNTAHIITDGHDTPSNPTTTQTPPPNEPPTSVDKAVQLEDASGKATGDATKDLQLPKRDSQYQYSVTATVRPLDVDKTLIIEDPLNNVQVQSLNANNIKIYDQSGKDVTKSFNITINKTNQAADVRATANQDIVNYVHGQFNDVKYKMVISHVSMKGANQDLLDGLKNDQHQVVVPNVADVITDHSNPKSPETHVKQPVPDETPTTLQKEVFATATASNEKSNVASSSTSSSSTAQSKSVSSISKASTTSSSSVVSSKTTNSSSIAKSDATAQTGNATGSVAAPTSANTQITLPSHDALYHYELTATIRPSDVKNTIVIDDPMNNVQAQSVKAENVHVYDESGKDVTKSWTVAVNKEKNDVDVKLTAGKDITSLVHAADHDIKYKVTIDNVTLKGANASDEDALRNALGQIVVPNQGSITTDHGKTPSNQTTVDTPKPNEVPSSIRKQVFTQSTELKDVLNGNADKLTQNNEQTSDAHTALALKNKTDAYQYVLTSSVRPSDVKDNGTIVISDALKNVQAASVKAENIKVYDAKGQDVSKDFKIAIQKGDDAVTVSATANADITHDVHEALSNQVYKVVISNVSTQGSTYDEQAAVKGYDGELVIPNTAELTTDKSKTLSNPTKVTTPAPKQVPTTLGKSVAAGSYKDNSQTNGTDNLTLKSKSDIYHYILNANINPRDVEKTLVITDPLKDIQQDSVKAENVHIYDAKGKDVTKDFKIDVKKDNGSATVSATADATVTKAIHESDDNVQYKMIIDNVSIAGATTAQERALTNGTGNIDIPNTASITTDKGKTPSNTTHVNLPAPDLKNSSIQKSVLAGAYKADEKSGQDNLAIKSLSDVYHYVLNVNVKPTDVQKTLVIDDPMEDIQQASIKAENIHIYDAKGQDVTKDFKIDIQKGQNGKVDVKATANPDTVKAVNNSETDVQYKMVIDQVSLKDSTTAQQKALTQNGQVTVPNTASLTTDKGKENSNQTKVTTPAPVLNNSAIKKSVGLGDYQPGKTNSDGDKLALKDKEAGYHYVLDANIKPSDVQKTLIIHDAMNQVQANSVKAENIKVYDAKGQDVTKDFKVAVQKGKDAVDVTATANPNTVKAVSQSATNVQYKLVINGVSLKGASQDALNHVTNKAGQIDVPNTADLTTDKGKVNSNTTHVTAPNPEAPQKTAPQKSNPSNPGTPASPAAQPGQPGTSTQTTTTTTTSPVGNIKTGLSDIAKHPAGLIALIAAMIGGLGLTIKDLKERKD